MQASGDVNPTPTSLDVQNSTMNLLSDGVTEDRETIGGNVRNELERPLIHKLQQLSMESYVDGAAVASSSPAASRLRKKGSASSTSTPERNFRGGGLHTPDTSRMSPSSGNSPPTSQVSVGSIPPVLAAALLVPSARHYDLTPVMRNTANLHQRYADDETKCDAGTVGPNEDDYNVVSPERGDRGFLHGEHLALPSDLSAHYDGPVLPPLQTDRSRSAGALLGGEPRPCHHHLRPHSNIKDELLPPPAPIQFPSRKYYSFTSRKQYEHGIQQQPDGQATFGAVKGLTPYQPSRQEDLDDVGDIPEEELERIFVARRAGAANNGLLGSGESHANHRLLQNPIPMEERQWSIPSIRMANHLTGGSTASYTDNTDNTEDEDESPLFIREDDASWSSRGSSLCLHDEHDTQELRRQEEPVHDDDGGGVAHGSLPTVLSTQQQPKIIMEQLDRLLDQSPISFSHPYDTDSDEECLSSSSGAGAVVAAAASAPDSRRKRKLRVKEQQALDWLQSVEADTNVLAEAASSKFLTGNNNVLPLRPDDIKLHPNKSSPSRLLTTTTTTTTTTTLLDRTPNNHQPKQQQQHALRRQTLPPSIFKAAVLPTSVANSSS